MQASHRSGAAPHVRGIARPGRKRVALRCADRWSIPFTCNGAGANGWIAVHGPAVYEKLRTRLPRHTVRAVASRVLGTAVSPAIPKRPGAQRQIAKSRSILGGRANPP